MDDATQMKSARPHHQPRGACERNHGRNANLTALTYHLAPVRAPTRKKVTQNKGGKRVERREAAYAAGGIHVGASTTENSVEVP